MIISASRRTDIPAFYSAWLVNRLKAGEVMVPHPRNPKQAGRVTLKPDVVDCLVFWTKNPKPMFDKLSIIEKLGYRFYFTFTLTPYGRGLEPGLPPKGTLVDDFKRLSDRLGPLGVDWRYDPVIINGQLTPTYHQEAFGRLAAALSGYTTRCILSFIDPYAHLKKMFPKVNQDNQDILAASFSKIAEEFKLPLLACVEKDFSAWGIGRAACLDQAKIATLIGYNPGVGRDFSQRPGCGCLPSVDIGVYNTCGHGCAYCYAVTNRARAVRFFNAHSPEDQALGGGLRGDELIIDRKVSARRKAPGLFD